MKPSALAMDTCWLADLDGEAPDKLEKLTFLMDARRLGVPILLDHEDLVLAEYVTVLQPDGIGRSFFADAVQSHSVHYYAGLPSRACVEAMDAVAFDPADRMYVGIAQRAGGVYLTSEEKHLRSEIQQAVRESCGVEIVEFVDAAELLGLASA